MLQRFPARSFTLLALVAATSCTSFSSDTASSGSASRPASVPAAGETSARNRATRLVDRMIATIGGRDRLYRLRDVEYRYTYRRVDEGTADVSLERYVFDGELSWARYDRHEIFVLPEKEGPVLSFYDGESTTSLHDGEVVTGEPASVLHFLRKTNYYWFCMFFKLADPGVRHEYLGKRVSDHIEYDVVEVDFGSDVGESPKDRYILYFNPYTHLVDKFLFNVTAFGLEDPFLMEVRYTQVDGALLPTCRWYRPAVGWDSDAVVPDGQVVQELSEDVRFGNGFTRARLELR